MIEKKKKSWGDDALAFVFQKFLYPQLEFERFMMRDRNTFSFLECEGYYERKCVQSIFEDLEHKVTSLTLKLILFLSSGLLHKDKSRR